jgi:hypothetical protein
MRQPLWLRSRGHGAVIAGRRPDELRSAPPMTASAPEPRLPTQPEDQIQPPRVRPTVGLRPSKRIDGWPAHVGAQPACRQRPPETRRRHAARSKREACCPASCPKCPPMRDPVQTQRYPVQRASYSCHTYVRCVSAASPEKTARALRLGQFLLSAIAEGGDRRKGETRCQKRRARVVDPAGHAVQRRSVVRRTQSGRCADRRLRPPYVYRPPGKMHDARHQSFSLHRSWEHCPRDFDN